MKNKFISFYFDVASRASELSYANRLKVGAVVVKDHRILSYGYNGTPVGFDNDCELHIPEQTGPGGTTIEKQTITKPEVIHAEQNALMKVARSSDSTDGAVMFVTHSPCVDCAKLILQSGIKEVYYIEDYRSTGGIDILRNGNVKVVKNG